jgi:5-methylcytosine-specific restriction enzyme B
MNFWQLQMSQGLQSEEQLKIDEIRNIITERSIIGTGEWKDNKTDQCRQFKESMAVGDIVLVRQGISPIAMVEIAEKNTSGTVYENEHRVKVLSFYDESIGAYSGKTQGTLTKVANKETDTAKFIINWYSLITSKEKMKSIVNLLKYKKQIILQGPPGTGKTKLAKKILQRKI